MGSVIIKLDDHSQLGFEIERLDNDQGLTLFVGGLRAHGLGRLFTLIRSALQN